MLTTTARDCLSSYLAKWRKSRKEGKAGLRGGNDSRKVDMVSYSPLLLVKYKADSLLRRLSILRSFAYSPRKGARPRLSSFSPSLTTASSFK